MNVVGQGLLWELLAGVSGVLELVFQNVGVYVHPGVVLIGGHSTLVFTVLGTTGMLL